MARLSARLLGSFVVLVLLVGLGQARTVSWTAAGGTPMWDFANNWDCRCVPGPGDDVIINVPSIVGEVRPRPALAPPPPLSFRSLSRPF